MPVKAGVVRVGTRQTRRGAAETFTGVVFQDPVLVAEAPSRMGGSVVTFTPGARTAWHSHPVGQTLYCLSGVGRICFEGEKPQVLNPGDIVNIPPAYDALARRLARSPVRASGAVGSRRTGPGHILGQARQRRRVHRPGDRRVSLRRAAGRVEGGAPARQRRAQAVGQLAPHRGPQKVADHEALAVRGNEEPVRFIGALFKDDAQPERLKPPHRLRSP